MLNRHINAIRGYFTKPGTYSEKWDKISRKTKADQNGWDFPFRTQALKQLRRQSIRQKYRLLYYRCFAHSLSVGFLATALKALFAFTRLLGPVSSKLFSQMAHKIPTRLKASP
ncbi:hypothetical protein TNIN_252701 [Trichonephila inaurata madagascariensis]|uniref:Uncharacterized protein n=1 Tax=Trichonephila inaurata madagascariensis TaxID=2747483 RepID=A0A8X6XV99_9ARAC|nr:hypothetical protein TNIN_252701 [Trichonephila inaurata madagascariensis]